MTQGDGTTKQREDRRRREEKIQEGREEVIKQHVEILRITHQQIQRLMEEFNTIDQPSIPRNIEVFTALNSRIAYQKHILEGIFEFSPRTDHPSDPRNLNNLSTTGDPKENDSRRRYN